MKTTWILAETILALIAPRTYAVIPIQPQAIKTPYIWQNGAGNGIVEPNIWNGYTELKHICSCESWGAPDKEPRELKDGSVLHGFPNAADIGACQINSTLWQATAQKLGDDIYSYDGNITFAKVLYDKYGNKPWNWSRQCWKNK